MSTSFRIKTWVCGNCNYRTDSEPTEETLCPSCSEEYLVYKTDITQRLTIRVMDEAQIDKELETPPRDTWTQEQKDVYRIERESDMNRALARARLLEDNS